MKIAKSLLPLLKRPDLAPCPSPLQPWSQIFRNLRIVGGENKKLNFPFYVTPCFTMYLHAASFCLIGFTSFIVLAGFCRFHMSKRTHVLRLACQCGSSPEWEVVWKGRLEPAALPLLPHKLHLRPTHIWSDNFKSYFDYRKLFICLHWQCKAISCCQKDRDQLSCYKIFSQFMLMPPGLCTSICHILCEQENCEELSVAHLTCLALFLLLLLLLLLLS